MELFRLYQDKYRIPVGKCISDWSKDLWFICKLLRRESCFVNFERGEGYQEEAIKAKSSIGTPFVVVVDHPSFLSFFFSTISSLVLWLPPLLYYSYFLLLPFPMQFSLFLSAQDLKPMWKSDTNLKYDRTLSLILLLLLMLSKLMGLVFNLPLQ